MFTPNCITIWSSLTSQTVRRFPRSSQEYAQNGNINSLVKESENHWPHPYWWWFRKGGESCMPSLSCFHSLVRQSDLCQLIWYRYKKKKISHSGFQSNDLNFVVLIQDHAILATKALYFIHIYKPFYIYVYVRFLCVGVPVYLYICRLLCICT